MSEKVKALEQEKDMGDINSVIRFIFFKNWRTKQTLAFVVCALILLGLVISPGEMAQAAELTPQGQESFNRGMVAAQQQDFNLALRYFLEAQKADPDEPQIWFNLGLASSKLPGYELRALAWFQLYLIKVPDAPNADAIRKQIGAIEVAFESKMGKILDQLSPLIETNQSDNSAYKGFNIAQARGYLGDFEGSGKELMKFTGKTNWHDAVIQFPETDSLWKPDRVFDMINKGQIEYLLDLGVNGTRSYYDFNDTQFYDSLRYIKDYKELLPGAGLKVVLSDVAGLSASYRVINGRFDPGPHSDPYWAEHYSKMYTLSGNKYSNLKDYPKAIEYYNKAIALNPKNIEAYSGRGWVYYFDFKDYPRAIEDYSKVLSVDPKNMNGYKWRGRTYEELNNYTKAIEDFDKLIELAPNNAGNLQVRGDIHYKFKNYSRAIEDFSKIIEIKGLYRASAYQRRGTVYYDLKAYPTAIADYLKAIELMPQWPHAYFYMGNAYFELKDYSMAIEYYNRAIQHDPNNFYKIHNDNIHDLALKKKADASNKAAPSIPKSSEKQKKN